MFKPYKYTKNSRDYYIADIDAAIDYVTKLSSYQGTSSKKVNTNKRGTSSGFSRKLTGSKKGFFSNVNLITAVIMIVAGFFILTTKVLVPVVSIYASSEEYSPVISPVPDNFDSNSIVNEPKDDTTDFKFLELSNKKLDEIEYVDVDGIKYPKVLEEKIEKRRNVPDKFYLTIPKLEIYDAVVETNSTNLDPKNALGHYNGSCLPDEACNTFIFGHSTFKSTPNKYKKGDYTAVFSRLDELEYGDEFFINYKDKTYRYVVELTKIDKPENINPLEEPLPKSLGKYDNTVELFTCTPPGTTKYRLSVVGKYVE